MFVQELKVIAATLTVVAVLTGGFVILAPQQETVPQPGAKTVDETNAPPTGKELLQGFGKPSSWRAAGRRLRPMN